MRFAVGYPVTQDEEAVPFGDVVREFSGHIAEVYFAWPGHPSGRSPAAVDSLAGRRLKEDLAEFAKLGTKLDLLLNANCYGDAAVSNAVADGFRRTVDAVGEAAGLDIVTTTSPFAARVLKRHAARLDVRASVNMRLGTPQALAQVAEVFDSFHLQRDYNRDFGRIESLRAWCDAHGKGLHLLANSGCLPFCATQTFHDNLVAHEEGVLCERAAPVETLACRTFLRKPENKHALLAATWVRPEDLHHYEPHFGQVKLATRMHHSPRLVVRAYVRGTHPGNLLDLLEPGHGDVFRGKAIDNTRFPDDWFEHVTACGHACEECAYCREVFGKVLAD